MKKFYLYLLKTSQFPQVFPPHYIFLDYLKSMQMKALKQWIIRTQVCDRWHFLYEGVIKLFTDGWTAEDS